MDQKKCAVVTGGMSGIGKRIAEGFRAEGYKVIVVDRIQGADLLVDLSVPEAAEQAATGLFRNHRVDVLVNNAGVSTFSPLVETSTEDFLHVLHTNLTSQFIFSREMIRHHKGSWGRIINISSTRQSMSEAGTESYSASKGGIYSLTHALMMSTAGLENFTVNSISPGWIHTTDDPLREIDHDQHPSGRVGRPEDIWRACKYLTAVENDFVNGENLVIDGGMTRKMIYSH